MSSLRPKSSAEPLPVVGKYPGITLVISALEAVCAVEVLLCDAIVTSERHRAEVTMALASVPHAPGRAPVLVASESAARAVSEAVAACRAGKRVSVLLHADELIDALAPIAEASHLPRAPLVVHVLAHAHAHDAARLRSGRDELAPALDIGAGLVVSSSVQEAADLGLSVRRAAEDSETPFIHIVDAAAGSAEINAPELALVETYLGGWPARASGSGDSIAPGASAEDATRATAKRDERSYAARAPFALQSAMRALGDCTGRPLSPIDRAHAADAEDIVVAVGGAIPATLVAVRDLRREGRRVGVVGVRSLRPFFAADLVKAVARAHAIIVLEPLDIALAPAGPVATALKAAFADALTWTPGFPGVGKIPPIISATVATLEAPIGPDEVHAALAEIEDGEQARRVIVFGTSSDETRPRPPSMRPPSIRPGST